jgi:hypothetical protein
VVGDHGGHGHSHDTQFISDEGHLVINSFSIEITFYIVVPFILSIYRPPSAPTSSHSSSSVPQFSTTFPTFSSMSTPDLQPLRPPVRNLDVMPTVMAWLGIRADWADGQVQGLVWPPRGRQPNRSC